MGNALIEFPFVSTWSAWFSSIRRLNTCNMYITKKWYFMIFMYTFYMNVHCIIILFVLYINTWFPSETNTSKTIHHSSSLLWYFCMFRFTHINSIFIYPVEVHHCASSNCWLPPCPWSGLTTVSRDTGPDSSSVVLLQVGCILSVDDIAIDDGEHLPPYIHLYI